MRSSFRTKSALPFLFLALLTTGASGVPMWDSPSIVGQPDGSTAEVRLFGDEFYHWLESPDGYTVVRDPDTGWLCYAEVSADGRRLNSTGVRLGDRPPSGLEIGLRLDDSVVADIVAMGRSQTDPAVEKIQDRPVLTHGQVMGLTILVDFPDLDFETDVPDPADQQAWLDDIHDFLNLVGYTGHGNIGSVFDYYQDVSGNSLFYNNQLTSRFYESTATRADLNVGAASLDDVLTNILLQMDAEGFDFSQFDSNDDGLIDAINIYYWGPFGSKELWAHYADMAPVPLDGLTAEHYTVCALRNFPELRTFCHENGHMLGQWPDLYSVSVPRDGYGLGDYCLMAYGGGSEVDPVHPSAFPKKLAGWMELVVLDRAGTGFVATSGNNTGYIIPHPDPTITSDYFLVENRQELGRDDRIDDSGLAIYHVDEIRPAQMSSNHYMVHLVQADGLWQLENEESFGNATDLFAAPDDPDYDPYSDPRAAWWNGDLIESYIQNVSSSGPVMTFDYPGCAQLVRVTVTPPDLGFEWTMTGSGGFSYSGTANREIIVPTCGEYTVSFENIPLYSTPSSVTQNVGATGDPFVDFAGTYALSIAHGGPSDLGDTGNAAALSALDFDNDGDEDLFIANQGTANRLLVNAETFGFIDSTPPELAGAEWIVDASWADGDNDGDQDLFLVRGPGQHMLLDHHGAALVDISSYSGDLNSTGVATAGNWGDIDNDGVLDLFLTRPNDPNKVYEGVGNSPIQLLPGALTGNASGGSTSSGVHWGDINNDGWNDLLVNSQSSDPHDLTRVLENFSGEYQFWSGSVNTVRDGADAAWADFNNDGILDIAVLATDGSVVCYLIDAGGNVIFNPMITPNSGVTSLTTGDFNNDGWVDLYATRSGGSDMLAINQLRTVGGFSLSTKVLTFPDDNMLGNNQVAVAGDFNADGKLDLYVARDNAPNFLIENQAGGDNHWLEVDLTGVACNRDALGARITVVAGGLSLVREVQSDGGPGQDSKVAHFGLGSATAVDLITVSWPGLGPMEVYPGAVAVDSRISITQVYERPVVTSYIERDGQQLPIADNNLRGCPSGDGDMLVIQLDFHDESMADVPQIHPGLISLITDGLGYKFFDDTSLDTPGTPSNGYKVTLRRSQVGGCGQCVDGGCNNPASASLPLDILYLGMPVDSIVGLRVQSADISDDGRVNLVDLSILAKSVFSHPENFAQYFCPDFVHDGVVNHMDVASFTGHFDHRNPSAAASSGPEIVSDVKIRFLPEVSERAGAGEIRVQVLLESETSISAVAAVLDGRVGPYTVVGWEVGAGLEGRSLLTAREKSPNTEWILTGMNLEKENSRSLLMGTLVLAPSPEAALLATRPVPGDFNLLMGEIMTAEGVVESLVETNGGDQMPAHRHGIQRVFPNPFNPSVTIEYALDHPAQVTLQIHDLNGRLVATLVNMYQTPNGGTLSAVWDGRNSNGKRTSSGLYFWRLAIGEQVESGRMMLIK